MRFGPIESEAEAERVREWRDKFAEGADYFRTHERPPDVALELWKAQAEACESMVEDADCCLEVWAGDTGVEGA